MGRRGFTLIELLVALTLGALVVLLAHRVVTAVTDGAHRLAEAREREDRAANGRRLLVQLAGSLDVGTALDRGRDFAGAPDRVEFSSWSETAGGWLDSRRVVVQASGGRLAVEGLQDSAVVVSNGVTALDCDYLLDYGERAAWLREWRSPVTAPLAIRLRIAVGTGVVDTLLLPVGPRG
jgi:prepilin-type N-terminal cleavage/methylation domain-containing protein